MPLSEEVLRTWRIAKKNKRHGVKLAERYRMKGRMHKTLSQVNGCHQRGMTESKWYERVQTFIWMTEENIAEVPFDKEHLLEALLNPYNLNQAYKVVVKNHG